MVAISCVRNPNKKDATSQDLPVEILTMIFDFYRKANGVSELLMNVAEVCVRWRTIIAYSSCWTSEFDPKVSVDLLLYLCRQEQSAWIKHLNIPNASYLKKEELQLIFSRCDKMKTANLFVHQRGETILNLLADHCRKLERFGFGESKRLLHPHMFYPFLFHAGRTLTVICITECEVSNIHVLTQSISDLCPKLRQITLTKLRGNDRIFPLKRFQLKCKFLRSITLQNFLFRKQEFEENGVEFPGFPELKRFTFLSKISSPTICDYELLMALGKSPKLRKLDIRGTAVSLFGLGKLPAFDLRELRVSRYLFHDKAFIPYMLKMIKGWKNCNITSI